MNQLPYAHASMLVPEEYSEVTKMLNLMHRDVQDPCDLMAAQKLIREGAEWLLALSKSMRYQLDRGMPDFALYDFYTVQVALASGGTTNETGKAPSPEAPAIPQSAPQRGEVGEAEAEVTIALLRLMLADAQKALENVSRKPVSKDAMAWRGEVGRGAMKFIGELLVDWEQEEREAKSTSFPEVRWLREILDSLSRPPVGMTAAEENLIKACIEGSPQDIRQLTCDVISERWKAERAAVAPPQEGSESL